MQTPSLDLLSLSLKILEMMLDVKSNQWSNLIGCLLI